MFIYKASDRLVFNILNKINYGYLEVTSFDGSILKFGNPKDNLKANLIIKKSNFTYNLITGGSIDLQNVICVVNLKPAIFQI